MGRLSLLTGKFPFQIIGVPLLAFPDFPASRAELGTPWIAGFEVLTALVTGYGLQGRISRPFVVLDHGR
jgi:hypothetical protein